MTTYLEVNNGNGPPPAGGFVGGGYSGPSGNFTTWSPFTTQQYSDWRKVTVGVAQNAIDGAVAAGFVQATP